MERASLEGPSRDFMIAKSIATVASGLIVSFEGKLRNHDTLNYVKPAFCTWKLCPLQKALSALGT